MFDNLVVQPIFNLLVFITAIIPGHNLGLAIIVFTILVRMVMWPLVKKQLHHSKEMRKMQPEIKRIKKAAAGDRQKESMMLMEMYKERNISPFGSLGTIIIQFIVLLGLYFGLRKLVHDPQALISFTYEPLRSLGWLKDVAANVNIFDETLLGIIDLTRPALGQQGWYFPALLLVIGSAAAQYFQSVQLMPKPEDGRTLKTILKEAGEGKQADQAEVSAAVMRGMRFLIPAMIFFFTLGLASALSLYWMVGGIVALIQQSRVLKQDEEELEAIADATTTQFKKKHGKEKDEDVIVVKPGVTIRNAGSSKRKPIIDGEIIDRPSSNSQTKTSKSKKRRK